MTRTSQILTVFTGDYKQGTNLTMEIISFVVLILLSLVGYSVGAVGKSRR